MRSIEHFRKIPIVLMTAFSLSASERQAMLDRDGVDTIINKPLPDLMELKAMLDRLAANKQTQESAAPASPASEGSATLPAPES